RQALAPGPLGDRRHDTCARAWLYGGPYREHERGGDDRPDPGTYPGAGRLPRRADRPPDAHRRTAGCTLGGRGGLRTDAPRRRRRDTDGPPLWPEFRRTVRPLG